MKKIINILIITILFITDLSAESSVNIKKFIKGNLNEKTEAVKKASPDEVEYLSTKAISFVLENKEFLENDRDLAALAVSGIFAIPQSYAEKLSEKEKKDLSDSFLKIYKDFSDETVKIAVLNKISKLNIPLENFKNSLNEYINNCNPESDNRSIITSSIQTIGNIGDSSSFNILFKCSQNKVWTSYSNEISEALSSLSNYAENEIISLIGNGNTSECRNIFNLLVKNQYKSQILRAKISENILARTIYIYENSNSATDDLIQLQFDSFSILLNQKWTRASETCIKYFEVALKEYKEKELSENYFCKVINGISEIAPIESVSKLSIYLSELNKTMESDSSVVSENVVLSVINTLGAIGDKNAFDSLLAVTYYNYSENVIAAARNALAKLKW